METKKLTYGKREIYFRIRYEERRSLKITVEPNLEVKVVAPMSSDDKSVMDKLRKRRAWVVKQQDYFREFLPQNPKREYVSGETHRYLGRQYRLRVKRNHKDEVKLRNGWINVKSRYEHPIMVEYLLGGWYKDNAERVFQEIIEERFERFRKYDIELPNFRIMRLKNKWGSCSDNRLITLNPELIKTPKGCIEYVINHEMCHLVENNHSPEFYQLQDITMPDWKIWKTRLERSEI